MKKIMFNDRFGLTQAVLEGRKTQTRRIITPQPTFKDNCGICWKGYAYGLSLSWDKLEGCYRNFISGTEYDKSCRRYRKDEVVAVAQSYSSIVNELEDCNNATCAGHYEKNVEKAAEYISWMEHPGFNNKMFVDPSLMPHQIRITNVRIQRLQDISDEDYLKEGIRKVVNENGIDVQYYVAHSACFETPREAFAYLIDKVSGKGTWDSNPYVFVYNFEFVK